jgi:hypothetical protein
MNKKTLFFFHGQVLALTAAQVLISAKLAYCYVNGSFREHITWSLKHIPPQCVDIA